VIFHSLDFIAFFLVTLAAYWAMPMRAQNVLMVVASYVFYGWVHPWWPVLLFATTFVDYWSARRMSEVPGSRLPAPGSRKKWLWLSIVSNLGLLGFYKYFGFFADNIAAAGEALGWHVPEVTLRVLLPAGISFYTFQSMSYTIDVYRGHAPARTRFIDVAAFVSFFPHLVAGPIMRATNLLPQFEQPRRFSASAARDATVLMVWGFFKKLVIADNVGVIANKVFALESPDFFVLWAGVFAFAIQIYADFSAYTDIARGVAKWHGFDLMRNFDHPYLATGPVDFWRRWNVSLSTWFRDYVYIPLGGSRRGPWRNAVNILITFLVSGFWHGASWNYVLWGAYHGLLLVMARLAPRLVRRGAQRDGSSVTREGGWVRPLQIAGMFILTLVGWLIFRETDLGQLWRDLRLSPMASTALGRDAGLYLFLLTALYSLPLWIHDVWAEFGGPSLVAAVDAEELEVHWRRVAMQAVMCGLMMAAVLTLRSSSSLSFIYFAF
jgi:alginate O-acetyltransferase complex protein AlgI